MDLSWQLSLRSLSLLEANRSVRDSLAMAPSRGRKDKDMLKIPLCEGIADTASFVCIFFLLKKSWQEKSSNSCAAAFLKHAYPPSWFCCEDSTLKQQEPGVDLISLFVKCPPYCYHPFTDIHSIFKCVRGTALRILTCDTSTQGLSRAIKWGMQDKRTHTNRNLYIQFDGGENANKILRLRI